MLTVLTGWCLRPDGVPPIHPLQAGPHNNAVCTPVTTCGASEYAAVDSTPTSDAVCVASSTCNPAIEIAAGNGNGHLCQDKCSPCRDGAAVQVACDAENARVCAQPVRWPSYGWGTPAAVLASCSPVILASCNLNPTYIDCFVIWEEGIRVGGFCDAHRVAS